MCTRDLMMDDQAEAAILAVWAQHLRPGPAVAPGCELQHLVDAVDGMRMQLGVLLAAVDALHAEVRSK
jgi:hypothetical protein